MNKFRLRVTQPSVTVTSLSLQRLVLRGEQCTGLAVILNMNEHRIKVCVYETEKVDEFIKNKAKGTEVVRLSGPTAFKRWSPSSRSPRG